ncbi:MAG: acyl-CoA thioesterase [Bacteroidetes bacterium]|nr:acyl-CoA thioesterase [Bacteroidota bacterium]
MTHITPIQIRFKDIDALGHVNNANHFTYFETARIKFFNDLIGEEIDWRKAGMILASTSINYRKPILITDEIFVLTEFVKAGRTSFELAYRIVKKINEKEVLLADGTSVMVCFSYEMKKAVEIPENWKKKMETAGRKQ